MSATPVNGGASRDSGTDGVARRRPSARESTSGHGEDHPTPAYLLRYAWGRTWLVLCHHQDVREGWTKAIRVRGACIAPIWTCRDPVNYGGCGDHGIRHMPRSRWNEAGRKKLINFRVKVRMFSRYLKFA